MVKKVRSRILTILSSGANFGTVVSLPVSGWLCSLELWGGWPLAFYLFGGLGLVWYVFWLIFIYDTPSQHATIDPCEKAFIEASVEKKNEVSIRFNKIFVDISTKLSLYLTE